MTTTTTNYGWVKPDVGASDDVWGGYINTDLDGVDSVVKGVSVVANAAYPASNPSGYQTAAQVASVVIGDNRIINGDMRIDQRNNGATGSANSYTVDRWSFNASQPNKLAWGRSNTSLAGFPCFMSFSVAASYVVGASESFIFYQPIEADMVSDFAWGTASAQPVTLSFWVIASVAGTFGGSILNYAQTRSYPFSFPVTTGFTKVVITIPGDTAGTWVMGGNNGALWVMFSLGAGSSVSAPAGAWTTGKYYSASGAVSLVATNGASFGVTGVKLEVGSVATPFNRQSLAKSMADCQRYYQTGRIDATGYQVAGASFQVSAYFQVSMRASPTLGLITDTSANLNPRNLTANNFTNYLTIYSTALATGAVVFGYTFSASAEL